MARVVNDEVACEGWWIAGWCVLEWWMAGWWMAGWYMVRCHSFALKNEKPTDETIKKKETQDIQTDDKVVGDQLMNDC